MSAAEPQPGVVDLGADDWVALALPDLSAADRERLGPARDVIFESLVDYVRGSELSGVAVVSPADGGGVSADAALLLSGARVHIQLGAAARQSLLDGLKVLALLALADGKAALVGFSVDFGSRVLARVTRLDEDELRLVTALAQVNRGAGGSGSTLAELEAELPDEEDLAGRLMRLADKGVVSTEGDRWAVAF